MKFGQEILYLEGWCARTQYNACCRLLGPGINIHLAENQLLREIFHLGNKVLPIPLTQKTTKLERVRFPRCSGLRLNRKEPIALQIELRLVHRH